jgi:serine/threonine protein kinase
MDIVIAPHSEPLPGYRLLERMGGGGFGEVWKCQAPGGFLKAIKFVDDVNDLFTPPEENPAGQERKALDQLKSLRHPFLLSVERVELIDRSLMIVMELADENLGDVLAGYQELGENGVPRDELLSYFDEVAEALDFMNFQHRLLHLDVKPDNLFLVAEHAKVGDFGLVAALRDQGGEEVEQGVPNGLSPAYASPEVFQGGMSLQSDQYSLAVVYCELRTGSLPFDPKSAQYLMLQHCAMEPNLSLLPPDERRAVARAMAKNPAGRFRCCKDFVYALRTGEDPPTTGDNLGPLGRRGSGARRRSSLNSTPLPGLAKRPDLSRERLLTSLINGAHAGRADGKGFRGMQQTYLSPTPRGLVRLQAERFLSRWNGRVVSRAEDVLRCEVRLPEGMAARYLGCRPVLELEVRLQLPVKPSPMKTEVVARLNTPTVGGPDAARMLREAGPVLLQNLSNCLDATPVPRSNERVPWDRAVLVRVACPRTGQKGDVIVCGGVDLSLGGVGFLSPAELPNTLLHIELGHAETGELVTRAGRVAWSLRREGGFEVGARFCEDDPADE